MSKANRIKKLKALQPKKAPNYQGLPVIDSRITPKLAADILKHKNGTSSRFFNPTFTHSGYSYNGAKLKVNGLNY